MQHRIKQGFFFASALLLSGTAVAHPSREHHQGLVDGIWHLLTQPDHLLMLLAGLAVGLYTKHKLTAFRKSQRAKGE
ncbi:HupE/UreJ family protein [Thiohalophilus sp.]|uniref:HupE/UreJ family protein n=1 Tax=Thiohalophilus sp. TaxID=3028392 RepID=UPI002ACE0480|nr:HupE/UreJ family protein [Thiohalophilus sp.]MDZ7804256.1 HupE/UreJ family protein [Thiohalophilus sp.]